jgi:tetratricopeptide (TPR) repeat protein
MAKRSGLYPRLVLVAATLLVYAKTLGFDFVTWDDGLHVYENPNLLSPSWEHWLGFWTQPFKGLYIPVTYSAWNLIAWLSPGGAQWPAPFHFCNLVFHLFNVLLVFEILKLLLARWRAPREGDRPELAAAFGAALFALHPLQVESVAWVTGFKEVLFGFFALSSFWAFLKACEGRRALGWVAVVLSLVAALCKPSGMMLPVLFAWIGYLILGFKPKRLARIFIPWCAAMIPIGLATVSAQPPSNEPPSFLKRFWVAGDALSFYFSKLVYPHPLLSQYDHSVSSVLEGSFYGALAVIAVLTAGGVLLFRRRRELLAGPGIFLLLLFPVLGFVPFWYQNLSTVSDHYVYFPMLGVSLLLAMVMLENRTRLAFGAAGAGLACLTVLSGTQALAWHDGKALALATLEYNPKSAPAHLDLGLAYRDENRLDQAIDEFKAAIALQEGYGDAYVDLGCAYATEKKFPEAVAAFTRAVELTPESGVNQFNLAKAMSEDGHLVEAAPRFIEAIRLSPEIEYDVQMYVAGALKKQGYLEAAQSHYLAALKLRK